jgi:hypothetical protein
MLALKRGAANIKIETNNGPMMGTFKAVHNQAPDYLCDLIVPYNAHYESKHLLSEHYFRIKSFGGRPFSTCAPRLWNSLPISLRSETDLDR